MPDGSAPTPYTFSTPIGATDFRRDLPIPDSDSDLSQITLNWCVEMLREAEGFIASQPNIQSIAPAMQAIMSQPMGAPGSDVAPSPLSRTRTNRLAKVANDNAALLTDVKPFWEYNTQNKQYEPTAMNYGKLSTHWYTKQSVAMRQMSLIKYCLVGGSAYGYIIWNPEIQDIDFIPLDTRNVLPIRPSSNETIQSSVGVIIKQWLPVNYFRDHFGITIKPEADGVTQAQDGVSSPGSGGLMGYVRSSLLKKPEAPKYPVACLYTMYLTDNRINKSQSNRLMGDWDIVKHPETGEILEATPLNNWSYSVPPGQPMYPNKRKICWVGQQILYDGPSTYWHGLFPVIKLTLDSWPWTWNGKGILWDLMPLQNSLDGYLRIMDDHAAQVAQPGAIMDKNSVSKTTFNQFNTRRPGWKIMHNPLAGKGVQIQNPPPLDAEIPAMRDWLIQEMNLLGGVSDPSQFMSLGQMPSDSTIDKFLQAMTPANRMRSRIIENFCSEMAMMLAYNFTQFYSLSYRTAILGAGGITLEDFDFDSNTMLPAHPFADEYNDKGEITPEALLQGPRPAWMRAKEFLRKFTFKADPASFLNSARLEDKMIKLQMFRMGIIDIWTLWEAWDIPNTGTLPDHVRTIPERLAYQAQIGLVPNLASAGRPASGQEPPKAEVKGGGGGNPASPRPVVSESK